MEKLFIKNRQGLKIAVRIEETKQKVGLVFVMHGLSGSKDQLIVGESDKSCPPRHQRILYYQLPGKKELHIIKGAPHTFTAVEHLAEIKGILGKWIDSVL